MMEDRQDYDLAFMLKFENVAWYENGKVRILDRRTYPMIIEHVECTSYEEVAQAIKDMVTQSEGPYTAAAMGMALAAYQARGKSAEDKISFLSEAAYVLSHARPTTTKQMQGIVNGALEKAKVALGKGISDDDLIDLMFKHAYDYVNNNYKKYSIIGRKLAELIPDNGTIMTQCFAGTVIGTMLRECRNMNKKVRLFCAETRPYYQGARLTASVAQDMGFDVTVISDNMPAYTLKTKNVDLFTSASDVITMDGHVVNKVGTFQIALACQYFNVPFYVTGTPDPTHEDMSSVTIEERDPQLVLESLGQKITMDGVKGYYPAFDETPPELITGIVTDKGVYKPENIASYLKE